jgi:hypothetical protein
MHEPGYSTETTINGAHRGTWGRCGNNAGTTEVMRDEVEAWAFSVRLLRRAGGFPAIIADEGQRDAGTDEVDDGDLLAGSWGKKRSDFSYFR